jgi:hypothetical protein
MKLNLFPGHSGLGAALLLAAAPADRALTGWPPFTAADLAGFPDPPAALCGTPALPDTDPAPPPGSAAAVRS